MFLCDSRSPSSPVAPLECYFSSSFSTFNRPVLILSGRPWPSLPMFSLQPSTLNCQPQHSPSPLYVPISSSLSPSTATLMDLLVSVADKRLTARLSPLDATLTKNQGRGGHNSGPRHSSLATASERSRLAD